MSRSFTRIYEEKRDEEETEEQDEEQADHVERPAIPHARPSAEQVGRASDAELATISRKHFWCSQQLHHLHRGTEASMDGSTYHTKARVRALKTAADDWVADTGIAWDTAACWHLPLSEMAGSVEDAEMRIGTKLRRYFNQLDRCVFKAQHKRGHRVNRFITLEHAASVGWHVHGILATPQNIEQWKFIEEVKRIWRHCITHDTIGLPQSRLAWCEPITGHYVRYTTKHSFAPVQHAKGTIDLQNTYLSELPN